MESVVRGDITTLESLLRGCPDLVQARSARPHRATLLHYVAANGVEDDRQKTPGNAVLIAETLLQAGAEVDACADSYGGGATTMNLLVSSVHPARAGLQVALVDTLLDFGAAVNGLADDGSSLRTALAFHYPAAAEALVRRGARIDTIVAAAALGQNDLVERFLATNGNSQPDLELALIWAAMHRRLGAVELLLRKGVSPGSKDRRGWTALHWAAFYGYPEIVDLLLKFNAPLEVQNEFGGTVLGQTVWTIVHERLLPDHVHILQTLVAAGAKLDPTWVDSAHRSSLDPAVLEALRRQA